MRHEEKEDKAQPVKVGVLGKVLPVHATQGLHGKGTHCKCDAIVVDTEMHEEFNKCPDWQFSL